MFRNLSLLAIFLMMTFSAFGQTPPVEPGVSHALAKWRAANYSGVRYKLNVTLEKGAPLMKGEIEISVNLTDEGASRDLILDWRTTQFDNDKDEPFAKVIAVNETSATGTSSTGTATTGAQASPPAMSAEREQASADLSASESNANFRAGTLMASGTPALQSLQSNEHLIIPNKFLKTGGNVIRIEFASPIKTSGAAVTRYVDKEDGAEYVYSLFVPSDASTAFPVFDQPDLKARFQLTVDIAGRDRPDWKVVSNTNGKSKFDTTWHTRWTFEETKPISTYVFAIAAGDFEEVLDPYVQTGVSTRGGMSEPPAVAGGLTRQSTNSNTNKSDSKKIPNGSIQPPATAGGSDLAMKIYVRKSQAGKFKQHAGEVFRLNHDGLKFLENWFDHKFPFPKYDLVLIPEFPFSGMEHAGATFLREDRIIFPTEPTKNDYITRANVIFHEAAHQWFGDTVTMRWFDDLWLKEGFAEFMAYKTLEKVMPEYNAWKVFYERNKQAAYLTDVTKGTTPIYQEIDNLSSAKSAYGNIVYRKAPSFLRQAEFYLGEDKFQSAVRAFLKKHEFANAEWTDLVKEFQTVSWSPDGYSYFAELSPQKQEALEARDKKIFKDWAEYWVTQPGVPIIHVELTTGHYEKSNPVRSDGSWSSSSWLVPALGLRLSEPFEDSPWASQIETLYKYGEENEIQENLVSGNPWTDNLPRLFDNDGNYNQNHPLPDLIFPNYQDYGYGIFLLDEKSRAYVLKNIGNEKDEFLRSMMWGSLWDSLRFYELAPKDYVELVIKNLSSELRLKPRKTSTSNGVRVSENSLKAKITGLLPGVTLYDESTIATLLDRVSTAMTYYLSEPPAVAGGLARPSENSTKPNLKPSASADGSDLQAQLENLMINKIQNAPTPGLKLTYYRAFVANASSENARKILKEILRSAGSLAGGLPALRSKDKFDIVTRLIVLGDADGLKLLAELEKTETDDAARRYAYAARAGIPTAENKAKYWQDFTENKEIPESWIEGACPVWNSPKHADLTLPYLDKALAELPNLRGSRKIFFVNGWLASFIGGQKSAEALNVVNKFLDDNQNLDRDLRLKILENADGLERAVKIRAKFGN